jgi:hypothetical protein
MCRNEISNWYRILIIVQRGATQSSLFIILQVHSKCFGFQPHPSSEVHKTVTTASGTGHIFCAATSLQRGQRWREVAAQKMWPVPETVVTVFCTPDDGCGWRPKHVEWTCRTINRLFCVASRWTIIINVHDTTLSQMKYILVYYQTAPKYYKI